MIMCVARCAKVDEGGSFKVGAGEYGGSIAVDCEDEEIGKGMVVFRYVSDGEVRKSIFTDRAPKALQILKYRSSFGVAFPLWSIWYPEGYQQYSADV